MGVLPKYIPQFYQCGVPFLGHHFFSERVKEGNFGGERVKEGNFGVRLALKVLIYA